MRSTKKGSSARCAVALWLGLFRFLCIVGGRGLYLFLNLEQLLLKRIKDRIIAVEWLISDLASGHLRSDLSSENDPNATAVTNEGVGRDSSIRAVAISNGECRDHLFAST